MDAALRRWPTVDSGTPASAPEYTATAFFRPANVHNVSLAECYTGCTRAQDYQAAPA